MRCGSGDMLDWDSWGPIAQRLEQQTHNLLVLGSNPSGPTILPAFPHFFQLTD